MLKKIYNLSGKKIWVAGHTGMVGAELVRQLKSQDSVEILTVGRADLDLTRQADVESWVDQNRPDVIFLAAAHVGGIHANATYPAEFIYNNIAIQTHIIHAAHKFGVERLLCLGSSCIYPKLAPQPMSEDALLTGPLEPTNEPYAIAKIAGLKMCEAYRRQYGSHFFSAMPTNLYGEGDNYHAENSHVVPGLIRRAHQAKISGEKRLTVWGTGQVLREFLHVTDCARALIHILEYNDTHDIVNVGSGSEVTIADLSKMIIESVGFEGQIKFDSTKPDGTPRKLMNSARLTAMGWSPSLSLKDGLRQTYQAYLQTLV